MTTVQIATIAPLTEEKETTIILQTITPAPLTEATTQKTAADAVALFIGGLRRPRSRQTMIQSLARVADVMLDREPADSHDENERRAYACDWSAFRAHHLRAILARLADIHRPATVAKHLQAVRGVMIAARSLRLVPADELRDILDVKRPRVFATNEDGLPGRALSSDDFLALAVAIKADGTPAGLRDAALLSAGYCAGLRREEIASLDVSDWNPGEQVLHVRNGKGGKARRVPVSESAARTLNRWIAARDLDASTDGAPLFVPVNKSGRIGVRRITAQAIYYAMAKRAAQAGVAAFSPHDLRRSCLSDLLDAGIDIATVANFAGHENPATTKRYDRRGTRAKSDAAKKLTVPF